MVAFRLFKFLCTNIFVFTPFFFFFLFFCVQTRLNRWDKMDTVHAREWYLPRRHVVGELSGGLIKEKRVHH